jgi:hypothetical protein
MVDRMAELPPTLWPAWLASQTPNPGGVISGDRKGGDEFQMGESDRPCHAMDSNLKEGVRRSVKRKSCFESLP